MKKSPYRNFDSIPTWKLSEILNSHHCTGIDGQDYEPYKDELEAILWSRAEKEQNLLIAIYEKDQKAYQKHLASSHKRKTA